MFIVIEKLSKYVLLFICVRKIAAINLYEL